ncbi:MAG: hypothetical protein U5M23_02495 [Marinagarivorans sp.]|nr:hypothetical protein [Marinagarivorans sp.]
MLNWSIDWPTNSTRSANEHEIKDFGLALGIEKCNWIQNCQTLEEEFHLLIGPASAIERFWLKRLVKNGCKASTNADDVLVSGYVELCSCRVPTSLLISELEMEYYAFAPSRF